MKEIIINFRGKEVKLYPTFIEDERAYQFLIPFENEPNQFGGLNTTNWQVLKSAAGYYIGCLTCSNYANQGEEPNYQWEPNMRDSDCYWSTREEAEKALIEHNYPIKF